MGEKEGTAKKLSVSIKYSDKLKKYVYGDTIDELIDGLELLKDGKFINAFVSKFSLSKEQLERLDSIILTSKSIEEICKYAQYRKKVSNVEEFEDALISLKASYRIVDFTKDVVGVNIAKMEDALIKIGNTDAIQRFAKEVKGANTEKLKKALFERKNAANIYFFFSNIQTEENEIDMEDISRAEDIIIASKDTQIMRFWAGGIKNANFDKMQNAVIESKKPWACIEFAKEVKGADISKLEDAVIASEDPRAMYDFVTVKGANIRKLKKAIKRTKDSYWIKRFERIFS